MKTRSDFVTNSSSSNFVIARRNECTYQMLYNLLNTEHNRKGIEGSSEYEYIKYEQTVDEVLHRIAERLYDAYDGMTLDGWHVHADTFGDENGCEIESLIYGYIQIDNNDMFKMGGFN